MKKLVWAVGCGILSLASAAAQGREQMPLGCDVSIADFPRRDGEVGDAPRIQRAIEAASPYGTVYVPKGVYEVGTTLWVTNRANVLMHNSAVLRATAEMEYVLVVDLAEQWGARPGQRADGAATAVGQENYNFSVVGGQIDGNAKASCMALDNYHHFTLRNVTFLNGLKYGLRVEGRGGHGYELVASDCYFKTVMRGCKGNEAVYTTGGDSHYVDCIVVDYTVGFHLGPRSWSNRLTRCHVWGGILREMLDDSVNFMIEEGDSILTECYADTGKIGFWIKRGYTRLFACDYFSNPRFKLDHITMIRHDRDFLLVSGGHYAKRAKDVALYKGCGNVLWKDIIYTGFGKDEKLPGNVSDSMKENEQKGY